MKLFEGECLSLMTLMRVDIHTHTAVPPPPTHRGRNVNQILTASECSSLIGRFSSPKQDIRLEEE